MAELWRGLRTGIGLALTCCVAATLVYLVRGMAPFHPFSTLPGLLGAFLSAGTAAGAVYGLLHSWRRSVPGRVGLGAAIALAACLSVSIFSSGTGPWSVSYWKALVPFVAIGGLIGLVAFRPRTGDVTDDRGP